MGMLAPRCPFRWLTLAGVLGVMAVRANAGAQGIRGTVDDQTAGTPVAGAVVMVLGPADSVLGRTLTDVHGRFGFAPFKAAVARLRVIRIGYEPALVVATGDSEITVELRRLAWNLATVVVRDRTACSPDEGRAAAAAMWRQAQAALLAAVVSRDATPAVLRIVKFTRTLGLGASRAADVEGQATGLSTAVATRAFSAGQSASFFAAHGYGVSAAGGYDLYGPDEDVLLDDSFARSHCFAVHRDGDHPGEIGIAFEPTLGRDSLVDISGTLWVDTATAQLRRLTFSYTPTEGMAIPVRGGGGAMTFATAANGVPFMTSWCIRTGSPITAGIFAQRDRSGYGRGIGAVGALLTERCARLAEATWADGTTWSGGLPTLTGVAVDRETRRPIPGLVVRLLNSDRAVRTDSLGRFHIDDIVPGPYLLAVEDSVLAVFGPLAGAGGLQVVGARPVRSLASFVKGVNHTSSAGTNAFAPIEVDSASTSPVTVEVPDVEAALARRCHISTADDSSGVLAVWVLAGGAPRKDAAVLISSPSDGRTRTVKTDDDGRAIVCGRFRGQPVQLTVDPRAGAAVTLSIHMREDRPVTLAVAQLQPASQRER